MRKRTFLAGHKGLAGSAIYRRLKGDAGTELIVADRETLDLRNQSAVMEFFKDNCFDEVILAAAKVGGIQANNTLRTDFLLENLQIQTNVIASAFQNNVTDLIFLGSSCIYPKKSECPIVEGALLTGPLESTNEPYAIAKIAGLKLCENISQSHLDKNYITLMPCNLYGLNDNYDLNLSHVFPAAITKIYLAKLLREGQIERAFKTLVKTQKINPPTSVDSVEDYLHNHGVSASHVNFWGTGRPQREFMSADDLASAIQFIRSDYKKVKISIAGTNYSLNCGSGLNVSISDLIKTVATICKYDGALRFNGDDLDGTPRKDLCSSLLNGLGWVPSTSIETGIEDVLRHMQGLNA